MTTDEVVAMRKIQASLVRNYVNTAKVEIDVHGNSVYLSGVLELGDVKSNDPTVLMTSVKKACLSIESEIRRGGSGIHDIQWKLRNWEKQGNRFIAKKE